MERYLQAAEELQAFRLEEINQFILNSGGQRLEAAIRLVQSLSSNQTHLSSRQEHPEWFEGKSDVSFAVLQFLSFFLLGY